MPADRHDDRRDAPQQDNQLVAPKHGHIREHVTTVVNQLRAAGRNGGGRSVDGAIERSVGRFANHTRDGVAGPGHGDGNTNDTLRAVIEGHRREMELGAIAHNMQQRQQNGEDIATAPASTSIEVAPPRDEKSRDPRSRTSPSRPSFTTMEQEYSYGPQGFSRSDIIDRPRGMPQIRMGGRDAPAAPSAPSPAAGLGAISGRRREHVHER